MDEREREERDEKGRWTDGWREIEKQKREREKEMKKRQMDGWTKKETHGWTKKDGER